MPPSLIRQFRAPGAAFRGKPFWAWNSELEPGELRRQVRVMHRMGLGGFFMHARVGLRTRYLSKAWFDCVKACVDEARRLGMEAWLYDEDRWPSGSAGGAATRDPRHRMKYLTLDTCRRAPAFAWDADTLAAFVTTLRGHTIRAPRRLAPGQRPRLKRGECVLRFRVATASANTWYNGATYLDTLEPEAVRRFLDLTHETYLRELGEAFGGVVPGIFMDEPNHGANFHDIQFTNNGRSLAWTPRLPERFRAHYGYDLLDHLPELFYDLQDAPVSRARHNYHDCVTRLFTDAFSSQIGAWCQTHGLQLTGHVLMEETPTSQTTAVGSAMRSYEAMQAPGMDLLTQYWREYDTAKQVSSVARQMGRRWRLSETYGCTGWDFPFLGHKVLGDWQAALGINLRCQHLAWYTMLGQAKRDYPASISFQSPWWSAYKTVEDYFARLHTVLSRGREVRDLLVIHPVESAWTYCRKGWLEGEHAAEGARQLDADLMRVRDGLLAGNIDFDYGDEDILARHGRVTRRSEGPRLRVNKAAYRAVLVPPMRTMRRSTLALLGRFADAGGRVVFAGPPPKHVDAQRSDEAARLAARCTRTRTTGAAIAEAVEASSRRVSITDDAGRQIVPVLHVLREDASVMYLFVCNVGHDFRGRKLDPPARDRTRAFKRVTIRGFDGCAGRPIELDPVTGEPRPVEARRVKGAWQVRTSLPMLGSRLFMAPKTRSTRIATKPRPALRTLARTPIRRDRWDIQLTEDNNLLLDRAAYRINGGRWRPTTPILDIDHAVRRKLGLPTRSWNMAQPWAYGAGDNPATAAVELRYTFDVRDLPRGELALGLEEPQRFRVTLNGHAVPTGRERDAGWWVDPSLRRVPLATEMLRTGRNELRMRCDLGAAHPGLEPAYLLGDFGVTLEDDHPVMVEPPRTLVVGDWTTQGLAFYAGSVIYKTRLHPRVQRGQRLVLEAPAFAGVALRVHVDGKEAGVLAWPPYTLDLTDHLRRDAPTELGIEVLGHRRNSHGPLHLKGEQTFIGPEQFESSHPDWTDEYVLAPVGLLRPPRLLRQVRG